MPSLVVVACFLPSRAKDLSALPRTWQCREPTGSTQVVIWPSAVTYFARPQSGQPFGRVAWKSKHSQYTIINSSFDLRWTRPAPSGGPPSAPMPGNYRCFISSVFAFLPLHLLQKQQTNLWGFGSSFLYRPLQISNPEIRLKISLCGNPLITQLGRYLRWPSVNPGPIRQGDRDR